MSTSEIHEAEIIPETQALAVRPRSQLPTVADLEQSFALAIRQRELLSDYIQKQLKPGKHFYQRGDQKPSLSKEGAEIILLPHGLCPDYEWVSGPEQPPEGNQAYQITIKCVLRQKGDPTSFVGSGIGSAGSMKQKKDGSYMARQSDRYLCHNATVKMAQKSAMIAATINSTAASEFFTQDMDPDTSPEPARQSAPPSHPKAAPSAPKHQPPTEKTRLWMLTELSKEGLGDSAQEYFSKLQNPTPLMPGEFISDLRLIFVPNSREELASLIAKVRSFADGNPPEPPYPWHYEAEDQPKTAEAVLPKATEQAADQGEHVIGSIEAISQKKGGTEDKPWRRYGIKVGEQWFNTFSSTIADAAKELKKSGEKVKVFYLETKYGKDATAIQMPDLRMIEHKDKR